MCALETKMLMDTLLAKSLFHLIVEKRSNICINEGSRECDSLIKILKYFQEDRSQIVL